MREKRLRSTVVSSRRPLFQLPAATAARAAAQLRQFATSARPLARRRAGQGGILSRRCTATPSSSRPRTSFRPPLPPPPSSPPWPMSGVSCCILSFHDVLPPAFPSPWPRRLVLSLPGILFSPPAGPARATPTLASRVPFSRWHSSGCRTIFPAWTAISRPVGLTAALSEESGDAAAVRLPLCRRLARSRTVRAAGGRLR